MTPEEEKKLRAERRTGYMERDFDPGYPASSLPNADLRIANAAEYSAYQLGQINRNLAKLVSILEKKAT